MGQVRAGSETDPEKLKRSRIFYPDRDRDFVFLHILCIAVNSSMEYSFFRSLTGLYLNVAHEEDSKNPLYRPGTRRYYLLGERFLDNRPFSVYRNSGRGALDLYKRF